MRSCLAGGVGEVQGDGCEPLEDIDDGWGSTRISRLKTGHQGSSGHWTSQPTFSLPDLLASEREGVREERGLGPCPVSSECEVQTCSWFGSERSPQNPTWPYGPAPELEPSLRFL